MADAQFSRDGGSIPLIRSIQKFRAKILRTERKKERRRHRKNTLFHYRESKPTRQRFTVRGKRKGEVLSTTTHECCMTASQFYSIEIISISKILLVLRASPSVWRDRWKRNALLSQKETKEGFSWITNKRLLLTHRRRRNNREREREGKFLISPSFLCQAEISENIFTSGDEKNCTITAG